MTIFEANPMEINQSMKAPLYSTFTLTQWNLDLSSKRNEYKIDENPIKERKTKKRVTFADEKGRELLEVITIERTDSIQKFDSLLSLENSRIISKTCDQPPTSVIQPYVWVTSFIQPASVYGRFKSDLVKQNVKLATAIIVKDSTSGIDSEYRMSGIIKVVNVCFDKRVFVRLSTDSNWTSSTDYEATYKSNSSDSIIESNVTVNTDEFEFQIQLPKPTTQELLFLEFAVCLSTAGGDFWDSNGKKNYRLDFCHVSASDGLQPMTMSGPTSSPYTMDYKPNLGQFRNEYTKYRAWNHFSDEMSFY